MEITCRYLMHLHNWHSPKDFHWYCFFEFSGRNLSVNSHVRGSCIPGGCFEPPHWLNSVKPQTLPMQKRKLHNSNPCKIQNYFEFCGQYMQYWDGTSVSLLVSNYFFPPGSLSPVFELCRTNYLAEIDNIFGVFWVVRGLKFFLINSKNSFEFCGQDSAALRCDFSVSACLRIVRGPL